MDTSFDTWRVNGSTIIPRESDWGRRRRRGYFVGQVRQSLYRKDARPDAGLVRSEGSRRARRDELSRWEARFSLTTEFPDVCKRYSHRTRR